MKEPIRILHVLTAMNYAGTETLLMRFYRNINRQKIQFDFAVSANCECAYDNEIVQLGGRIIHYPKYTGTNHFQYITWWKRFLAEHSEYHIIHGHIGSTASIYLGIAKKMGRYTIAHSHSTKANVSAKEILYNVYSYPTRYIADCFFGCSKQAIIDRYGKRIARDQRRAIVLNNAIDTEKFVFNTAVREKIRDEFQIPPDVLVLGTVGRISPEKNPFEIIRICEELKKRKINFVFLWFGMGELYGDIQREIKDKGLTAYIRLCGTRPDINNVLQAMDIFLFPSIYEGLGIAGVEAQAAGLPTLCSDTIPDEAKVTEMCEFIKINDTTKWCDKIQEYETKVKSKEYCRLNAYDEIIKAGYDVKEVAKWLEKFYLGVAL